MNKNIDFVNGNTKKCLLEMTVPMIIAMFLNMAYNLVDSLWIGNLLGEQAYAALTNSTPIILILTSIGMGATNGLAILLSQVIGAKNEQKKKNIIVTSFFVSIILSVFMTIVLEIFLEPILIVLNTPTEIFDMAKNYLSIYALGYVAVYLYLYFTAILRSFGNTMFQAVAMLVSTLLNAILDPIFINIIGFHGAAIATLISQIICLAFMCIYIYRKKLFNLSLSDFDTKEIMPFVKNAVPSVIQQSIPAISTTFLTAIVSTYSISAIAGYGVAGKLEMILFYPAMALNMVLTSIVGQCIGAQRIDRAKNYLKESINSGWSVRELKRQIDSSLYERLLLSSGDANKEKVLSLAQKGIEINQPADIIRDPYVFEFLGVPENKPILESDLENALVVQIEKFFLELGRGFMFVGTQQRVTLNNTHYYVDMVFYNKILRAYVLIELKTKKLTPEAAGQLNMYLNYYAAEVNDPDDNPPIGIILCTEKDSIAAEYALGGLSNNIFASRYVLYMPDKEQLIAQVEAVLKNWHDKKDNCHD